jgi:hypothetical protein
VARNFLLCDRDQDLLLPPSLREWLPEDHLAWFVLDAVAEMDLGAFYGSLLAGNASPQATRSYAAIREEVERMLAEAARADAEDGGSGVASPRRPTRLRSRHGRSTRPTRIRG